METQKFTIDLLTERPSDGAFILTLVEEGPWEPVDYERHLRRIQDRLYGCVDAAVDGHLVAKYPETHGRPIEIRLDCYDTPDQPVREFLARFDNSIRASADVQRDLVAQGFIKSLRFEYRWRTLLDC